MLNTTHARSLVERAALSIALASMLSGCGGSGTTTSIPSGVVPTPTSTTAPAPGPAAVSAVIQSVSVVDPNQVPHAANLSSGAMPAGGSGPAITLTDRSDNVSAVRGGSALVTFTTASPAAALLVGVSGMSGYYTADLTRASATLSRTSVTDGQWLYEPKTNFSVHVAARRMPAAVAGGNSYALSIDIPPSAQAGTVDLRIAAQYAAGGSGAAASPTAAVTVHVIQQANSSSSFQASLSWRAPVDIDLHVTPPGAPEIGYNDRSSAGGQLDTDSNAGCNIDNTDVENVTWPTAAAPIGVYRIRPDFYLACGVTSTVPYTLTVRTAETDASTTHLPAKFLNSFNPADADQNAGGADTSAVRYALVLPPATTDSGLVGRLILAEIGNPSRSQYTDADGARAAQAIRSIVENRKVAPQLFGASDSTTQAIVTAPGQFAGFVGGVDQSITDRIASVTIPPRSSLPARAWVPFFTAVLDAATEVYSRPADDPYAALTTVGAQPVAGGTYGVRTAGSSAPGGNFVFVGTLDGQDFYTLKPGVVP